MKPRILFADSHQILRYGVAHALAGRAVMAGSATTLVELFRMVRDEEIEFDLLLMELDLAGRRTLRVMDELGSVRPEVRVVVMTSLEELAICQAVLRQGAAGFVGKSWAHLELPTAINVVMAGGRYISPTIVAQTLRVSSSVPDGTSVLDYLMGDVERSMDTPEAGSRDLPGRS